MTSQNFSTEKLREDLRHLSAGFTKLAEQAVDSLSDRLKAVTESAAELPGKSKEAIQEGASAVDGYVRQKPYHALGIAAAAGLALGAVLKRK